MQADANPRGEALASTLVRESPLDRQRAFECQIDVVKRQEEAIPGGLHLLTSVLSDKGTQGLVVPSQHARPGLVAKRAGKLGRVHDVGEGEGLHGAASGSDRPRTAGPSERRQQRLSLAVVGHRSEVLESRPRGFGFHRSPNGIPGCFCLGHQDSGARDLVGSIDL